LNGVLIEREDGFGYQALTEFAETFLRELNLKSFAEVELSYSQSEERVCSARCAKQATAKPRNQHIREMKALIFKRYGGPDRVMLADIPRPVPKPDEILVQIHAA